MPKGYWIARVDVTNAEEYPNYVKAAGPVYAKYGGKPIIRGGKYEAVEGQARSRNVVIEFESYEQALACYNSPEYVEARKIRQANSEGEILVVEGAE